MTVSIVHSRDKFKLATYLGLGNT